MSTTGVKLLGKVVPGYFMRLSDEFCAWWSSFSVIGQLD